MAIRQSNIELLRIISIVMVVVVHLDGASLGLPIPSGDISAVTPRDWWRLVVESLTIIGVNCFTLISGYFGIRVSWKGFLKFSATCMFYSLGIYLGLIMTGLLPFRPGDFCNAIMIFTHTDLWYVPAYLGLYILSPILNAGLKHLTQRQYLSMLISFIAFNCYAGWFWGASFNPNGYTLVQLIMMYLIGQYIGCYPIFPQSCNRYTYPAVYLAATLAISIQAVYCDPLRTFAYNSPLVIISSVAFFQWFTTMKFDSRFINTIAASAFAVYLFHKNPYVWGNIIKPLSIKMWEQSSLSEFSLFAVAFAVIIYAFTFIIDQLRIFLLSKVFSEKP